MPIKFRQLVFGILSIVAAFPVLARADDPPPAVAPAPAVAVEVVNVVDVAAPAAVFFPAAAPAAAATAPAKQAPPAPSAPAHSSILYLNDGDTYAGKLGNSATANVLRWQATGATEPFEFGVGAIRSAYFAPPAKRPAPEGEFQIELSDGDVLYGSLAAITKDNFEIDSPQFGHLKIARAEIHRVTPVGSSAFIYRGPNGLSEWTAEGVANWREEAGRLVTSKRAGTIKKSINIPEKARIEFEVAWTKTPNFALAFSASDKAKQLGEGYRLEVWGRKLVLVREVGKAADVAQIGELDVNAARVHLEAFYDHSTGEFSVQSLDGHQLGKIALPKKGGNPLRIVSFTNYGPEVSLEQLEISQWNGQTPPKIDVSKPRIHKKDGGILYGEVSGYDAGTKQFVYTADDKENRIDAAQIACLVATPDSKPDEKAAKASFRVGLHDGSRFSGDLNKVEGEKVYLTRRGIDQPLACAVANLRSLVGLKRDGQSPPYTKDRTGRWESSGVVSHGSVVAAATNADPHASCLVWKPRGSNTASPLRADISGRIVYRGPPPKPKESEEQTQQPRRGVFWGAVTRAIGAPSPSRQSQMTRGTGTLCLLTGDRIPCESIQIDEDGVRFTSSAVAADFVPHKSIKALEFVPRWTAAALAEVKRTRLLTLPRMQKGSPPTHLVSSTAGDFLRCRLMSMNADALTVEARLENKKLSRDRVACIIWLHDLDQPKSADAPAPAPPPQAPPTSGLQVQAVQSNGIRLTFSPKECDGATLAGVGDVLGACRVRLNSVDMLLLGTMIREVADEQVYADWKMKDAVEPQFVNEGAAGGANPGSESALVGKPAPDFTLNLLDGKEFKLSEQKGKVVVLDFWASWCGPCMQSMPEVVELMKEFKGKGVKYIAVNGQEDAATVKSALERLKVDPATVLDIDGAAAEKYQATSIPQLVIVGPDQKIADMFIGVSPGYIEQVRASIQKALDKKKDK